MTSVTFKAFPETPFYMTLVEFGTPAGGEAFWDVITTILSKLPSLSDQGISGYPQIAAGIVYPGLNITTLIDGFNAPFLLPGLHPSNTSTSLETTITELINVAVAPYPGQFLVNITSFSFPDFWTWYQLTNGPKTAGIDEMIGSRLIDKKALTGNLTALREAFKTATPPGSATSAYLVSGKGVFDAKPRGGSNAVNPAWRKAYVHSGVSCYLLHSLIA